jgi:hypothetical protein
VSLVKLSGQFTTTGQSDEVRVSGWFNLSLSGTWAASLTVERSFDNGTTWVSVESFTSNAEKRGYETEDVLYRISCASHTSGTVDYRISR